jgi:hypothetical protein
MRIDGRCHCGHITYEADVDPAQTMICHCADCQTLSGSAYRAVVLTEVGGFRLLSGELKIYVKTGESGNARPQSFCPQCGTPIHSTSGGDGPKAYALRLGAIRQREEFTPRLQLWCGSAQPWVYELGAVPATRQQPEFDTAGNLKLG